MSLLACGSSCTKSRRAMLALESLAAKPVTPCYSLLALAYLLIPGDASTVLHPCHLP